MDITSSKHRTPDRSVLLWLPLLGKETAKIAQQLLALKVCEKSKPLLIQQCIKEQHWHAFEMRFKVPILLLELTSYKRLLSTTPKDWL
jgi:hypothetical protein